MFLNEMDPQFGAGLERTQHNALVTAQMNLALLLNASVAISDANALHSEFCQKFFSSPDNLAMLNPDDELTALTGEQTPVSPVRLCLRDTCKDFVDLDIKEVSKRKGRHLHLTAQDASLPLALDRYGSKTQLRFSEADCGKELANYCRHLFGNEESPGIDELRKLDETFAKRVVTDFRDQLERGGTYALGPVYGSVADHPSAQQLRDAFLALAKPGYQRGVPSCIGIPMTVAYRKPHVIEPKASLTPVPMEFAKTELVLTTWGLEELSQLTTSQVLSLRNTEAFREFMSAKKTFMDTVLAKQATDGTYDTMLDACKKYVTSLDQAVRSVAGLAQRSPIGRYVVLLRKFRNQLTPSNCVRGLFLGLCAGATVGCSFFAGQRIAAGEMEAAFQNLGAAITAIGGAALTDLKIQGSFVFGFSSDEKRFIREAGSKLWFYSPFQLSSYFGDYE